MTCTVPRGAPGACHLAGRIMALPRQAVADHCLLRRVCQIPDAACHEVPRLLGGLGILLGRRLADVAGLGLLGNSAHKTKLMPPLRATTREEADSTGVGEGRTTLQHRENVMIDLRCGNMVWRTRTSKLGMSSPSCSTFLSDIQRRIAGLSLAGIALQQLLTDCTRCRSSIVDRGSIDILRRLEGMICR